LALTLPLVMFLCLALVQAALVIRQQLLVVAVTRDAARAASVAGDAVSAASSSVTAAGLLGASVATTIDGDRVRVEVHWVVPTDVPMVGTIMGSVSLQASATMLRER
jgi:hypothetical protein